MSQVNLSAVDASLAWYDPTAITQDLVDAYQNTLTFAQAVARGVNADPASQAYFNAMTQELAKLGWNITNSGETKYHQHANKIAPAAIVKSITYPYLDKSSQAQLAGVLDVIKAPDTSVTGFVDFFWKKSQVQASKTNMAMGKLVSYLNTPQITLLFYTFNFSDTSTRSLFVEVSDADLVNNIWNITMNLNMVLYNGYKAALIAKLAGKEADHIANAKVDL